MAEHWLYPNEMWRNGNPRAQEWNDLTLSCYQSYDKRCIPDGAAFEMPLHHLRPDIHKWVQDMGRGTVMEARWIASAFEYYLIMPDDVALLYKLAWGGRL